MLAVYGLDVTQEGAGHMDMVAKALRSFNRAALPGQYLVVNSSYLRVWYQPTAVAGRLSDSQACP